MNLLLFLLLELHFSLLSSAPSPSPSPAAASAIDSGSLLAGNAVLPDRAESFSPAPKSIQSVPPAHHSYPNLQLLGLTTSNHPLTWHLAFLQNSIRDFLRKRTSYDVLPLSFRLIVLDTDLLIKKSLNILIQNCKPLQKIPHHIFWPALMPRALPRARLGSGIGLAVWVSRC